MMDFILLKIVLFTFFIFLILHLLLLFFLKEEQVKQISLILVFFGADYCLWGVRSYGFEAALVALFIFVLSAGVYRAFIHRFLYEPSVSSRIIAIIDEKGKSLEEISMFVNAENITMQALNHLEGSKQVSFDSGTKKYFLNPKKAIFLFSSLQRGLCELMDISKN